VGVKYFSLLQALQTGSGVQPATYSIKARLIFPGMRGEVKRSGHEADPSPAFSVKIKNDWHGRSVHILCLLACKGTTCLVS
jgi:hypothetical protein